MSTKITIETSDKAVEAVVYDVNEDANKVYIVASVDVVEKSSVTLNISGRQWIEIQEV
jgi:hypothetical protein